MASSVGRLALYLRDNEPRDLACGGNELDHRAPFPFVLRTRLGAWPAKILSRLRRNRWFESTPLQPGSHTNPTLGKRSAAVFTGADRQVGGLPCGWLVNSKDGSPMVEPPHPVLAQGKVRHVGDPVAVVIAETLAQAKDAAELIKVSYQLLPAVVAADEAIKPGKPQLFDNAQNNICFDWHLGDKAAVEAAFTGAHHVTRLDIVNNRLVSNPMEPRAAIGEYDRA